MVITVCTTGKWMDRRI